VGAANYDFKHNRVVCNVPVLDIYFQVRQCLHKLLIKLADSACSFVMLAPGLIIVVRRFAKGGKNAVEVVRVLQSNVLFDNRDSSCPFVCMWSARRN
jgi:hypothetical protein